MNFRARVRPTENWLSPPPVRDNRIIDSISLHDCAILSGSFAILYYSFF